MPQCHFTAPGDEVLVTSGTERVFPHCSPPAPPSLPPHAAVGHRGNLPPPPLRPPPATRPASCGRAAHPACVPACAAAQLPSRPTSSATAGHRGGGTRRNLHWQGAGGWQEGSDPGGAGNSGVGAGGGAAPASELAAPVAAPAYPLPARSPPHHRGSDRRREPARTPPRWPTTRWRATRTGWAECIKGAGREVGANGTQPHWHCYLPPSPLHARSS